MNLELDKNTKGQNKVRTCIYKMVKEKTSTQKEKLTTRPDLKYVF